METIKVPVIRVLQNEWSLYIGVMNADDLFHIAEADRIRLESLKFPKYAGFQRSLVSERVNEIRNYLDTPFSTFPNSIIVSLDSEYILNWEDIDNISNVSSLILQKDKGVLTIIDGQHRAAALDEAPSKFQVIVTFFIDLVMIQSAQIFAKINSTQKAVNPSIAFQLFGYAEDRSPQKAAHDIAYKLNTSEGSPFYKKLRMLGTKDDWAIGTLSQSTFSKNLMRLYTKDPTRDEYRLLRKESLEEYLNYPLRMNFIKGEDEIILSIVWRFFYHVAKTWETQWNDESGRSILTKTTGYTSFLEVLRTWLLSSRGVEAYKDEGVKESLEKIKRKYEEPQNAFIRENYPAGHQGVVKLRNALLKDLDLD